MYAINLISNLNKSFTGKLRTVFSPVKYIKRNVSQPKASFDLKSQVAQDVVLFNFENTKLFVLINIFSAAQCISWTYLGTFFVRALDKSVVDPTPQKKFWGKVFDIERKYINALSGITIFFGWIMFFGTCFYSLRSIRKIILHKGGREVTIVTYSLPGFNTIKIPLHNVSSQAHRTKAKKFIPVKLKNTLFYYLIDVRGEFSNPVLFDFTAGMKRTF